MGGSNLAGRVSREDLLALFRDEQYTPLTAAEISAALQLRGRTRKALQQLLNHMVLNGEIVVIRKNRYSLGSPVDLVTGRLEVKRSGDGYLTDVEGELPVRVAKGDVGTALPGDLVVARLEPAAPGAPAKKARTGTIIRIVERAKRVIVGTLKTTGKFFYVVPLSPSYQQDFYVPDAAGAALGDRVVVQFTNWENRHVNPEGEIIEVIGPADNPSLDTLAMVRHYGFRDAFPEEVIQAAEQAATRIDAPGVREDLRAKFIFTVDPATARDFDDALSLERDTDGSRVLGVHIADVSHFVTPGGELDSEAAERGNSVYFPDKVLPMLPEQLSNGLCSLNPGRDRLTFSVFLTLDAEGHVVASRFARSVICSKLRLTYEQALDVLNTAAGMRCPVPEVVPEAVTLLKDICEIAQTLRRQRNDQFALDLDLPECELVLGPDGMIAEIRRRENDISHQMIEECMVAANEAVDRELARRGYPSLHRLHEPPTEERMDELVGDLQEMGYHPGNLKHRRTLAEFLRSIRTTPLADLAQTAVLRSMKRAVYSSKAQGHFGLAKKFYSHFTSPIRRYPDLIAHRVLAACLEGRRSPYTPERLEQAAVHCSWTEQTAEEAERALLEIKKYRYLEQELRSGTPRTYNAVVVKVVNFGMFVELPSIEVQGLVHISAISNGFVRFDAAEESLRVGAHAYKASSRVKVRVTGVNLDKRRIDFVLVEEPGARTEGSERRAGEGRGAERTGRESKQRSRDHGGGARRGRPRSPR